MKRGKGWKRSNATPPKLYIVEVEYWTGNEFTRTRDRIHAWNFDGAVKEAKKKHPGCTVMGVTSPVN